MDVLRSLHRRKKVSTAATVHQRMHQQGVEMTAGMYRCMMEMYLDSRCVADCVSCYELMRTRHVRPDAACIHLAVKAYLSLEGHDAAERVLMEAKQEGLVLPSNEDIRRLLQ